MAILTAIEAGLTSHEVAAAMQIGQFLGEQQKTPILEGKIHAEPETMGIPVEVEQTKKLKQLRKGYRLRSRRQQLAVRAKS